MGNILVFSCIVTAFVSIGVITVFRICADYYWFNRFEPNQGFRTEDYVEPYYKRKSQAKEVA